MTGNGMEPTTNRDSDVVLIVCCILAALIWIVIPAFHYLIAAILEAI